MPSHEMLMSRWERITRGTAPKRPMATRWETSAARSEVRNSANSPPMMFV